VKLDYVGTGSSRRHIDEWVSRAAAEAGVTLKCLPHEKSARKY